MRKALAIEKGNPPGSDHDHPRYGKGGAAIYGEGVQSSLKGEIRRRKVCHVSSTDHFLREGTKGEHRRPSKGSVKMLLARRGKRRIRRRLFSKR